MSAFELSWYLKIDKHRNCGVNPKATLADSLPQIKTALDHAGVVSISLLDCPKLGSRRLHLKTENGISTLTLGNLYNQSHRVKGFSASEPLPKAANDSPQKPIRDKELSFSAPETVYEIVEEFFATGTVSTDHMN